MREKTFTDVAEKLMALGKITMEDGRIFNARAAIEISDRADKLKNNSKAGKASAEKRQSNQGEYATDVQHPFNHTDTDTDTEKKEEGEPSSKKAIGSRLSDDWFLPMDWGEWAKGEGLSKDQIRTQADTFKDYWIAPPGAKGRKADWLATWRNWIRKSKERGNGNGYSKANGAAVSDAAARQIANAARFARSPGVADF